MALTIERFNIYKAEVERLGRRFDPMHVGVSRAFFVAKNAEEKAKAIETRFANQQRLVKADGGSDGKKSTASLLSFDQTLDAAGDSALFGTPDEIAAKLDMLRSAGIEHVLLNGPLGSKDNLRAFARDVMPAFTGSERAARGKPALVRLSRIAAPRRPG
jgi:alkanesulfonate monooxygenase SsuD/methylene tetrahydromethanopterin reductase-like flavin-dependent oxidoreductase (luciferase family)